jgi:MoaA/NifB/PqqE/SkfB family radical SAM enzyme
VLTTVSDVFEQNRRLNEREFEQGKIVLESRPRELLVILTTRCNLDCIMCTREVSNKVLPEEVAFKVAALFPYLETINWQGGEAFCVDYFQKLVKEAGRHPNTNQWVTTSGILITKEWADTLVRSNVFLCLSIDGVTRSTYEYIRRGAEFDALCRNLDYLNDACDRFGRRIRLELHATVMRSNYRELDQFVEFAKRFRFDQINFKPVLYVSEGENIFVPPDPAALDYLRKTKSVVFQKGAEQGVSISWSLPDPNPGRHFPALADQRANGFVSRSDAPFAGPGCKKPWKKVLIDISRHGHAFPECYCMIPSGNILHDSLEEVWNGPGAQEYRRRLVENRTRGFCSEACVSGQVDPALLLA